MAESLLPATPHVLIVAARFAPEHCADGVRALHLAKHLPSLGWRVSVLTTAAAGEAPSLPAGVRLIRLQRPRFTLPGWRTPGMRMLGAFHRAALAIHDEDPIHVVLHSHTDFPLWRLGPLLSRSRGVPYVLDWQDPWLSDYYDRFPQRSKPGGRFKFAIAQALARRWEPAITRAALAHICVSSAYPTMLRGRYPDVSANRCAVIPFGFDFDLDRGRQGQAETAPVCHDWLYIGRGGEDMALALRLLFTWIQNTLDGTNLMPERIRFIGTSYAGARGAPTVLPAAQCFQLRARIEESTQRVPPDQVMRLQDEAKALILLGSDDRDYAPSKTYALLASGRPVIAVMHEASDVCAPLKSSPGVLLLQFNDHGDLICEPSADDLRAVLAQSFWHRALTQYSAASMARFIAAVLGRSLA